MKIEYYDLGLPNRDATDDKVTVDAAEAIKVMIQDHSHSSHAVHPRCAGFVIDMPYLEVIWWLRVQRDALSYLVCEGHVLSSANACMPRLAGGGIIIEHRAND